MENRFTDMPPAPKRSWTVLMVFAIIFIAAIGLLFFLTRQPTPATMTSASKQMSTSTSDGWASSTLTQNGQQAQPAHGTHSTAHGSTPAGSVHSGTYSGPLTLLSPVAGQVFHLGKTYKVSWVSHGLNQFTLTLVDETPTSVNYRTKCMELCGLGNTAISSGSYNWTIPDSPFLIVPGDRYRVVITSGSLSVSSGLFTIN